MTQRLYQTHSYIRDFEATVSEGIQNERAVVLDRTAFYPSGGGQPCDKGRLSGMTVMAVKIIGGQILHFVEGELVAPGTSVHATLDWEHRYKLMRTHTAMHVLCGVVFRDYGAQVTGGDMEPLKGRMDFEFETMRLEFVRLIEEKINAEVTAARALRVKILPREEAFQIPDLIRTKVSLLPVGIADVRTVEIEGLDLQADGGTHVGNTREVGRIRVVDYKSKGKNNKRIEVALE